MREGKEETNSRVDYCNRRNNFLQMTEKIMMFLRCGNTDHYSNHCFALPGCGSVEGATIGIVLTEPSMLSVCQDANHTMIYLLINMLITIFITISFIAAIRIS